MSPEGFYPDDAVTDLGFMCCFCGEGGTRDDRITLSATWSGDDGDAEQRWWSHKACLVDALNESIRGRGDGNVRDEFLPDE